MNSSTCSGALSAWNSSKESCTETCKQDCKQYFKKPTKYLAASLNWCKAFTWIKLNWKAQTLKLSFGDLIWLRLAAFGTRMTETNYAGCDFIHLKLQHSDRIFQLTHEWQINSLIRARALDPVFIYNSARNVALPSDLPGLNLYFNVVKRRGRNHPSLEPPCEWELISKQKFSPILIICCTNNKSAGVSGLSSHTMNSSQSLKCFIKGILRSNWASAQRVRRR